jgi:hypothetical protein
LQAQIGLDASSANYLIAAPSVGKKRWQNYRVEESIR